ncbi:MAG: DNA polymerase III subunit alpha, partial [Sinomonas sp.]|nr:DNA polymerase III subunit alpha [Sinomonas sp.]
GCRLGVPILPADINASRREYRVERVESGPDAGKLGIRLPLSGLGGVSAAEATRLVKGQPYASIAELRDRARLTDARVRRLAKLGVFDSLHREAVRRGSQADLVSHLAQLAARSPRREGPMDGQLSLELGDGRAAQPFR